MDNSQLSCGTSEYIPSAPGIIVPVGISLHDTVAYSAVRMLVPGSQTVHKRNGMVTNGPSGTEKFARECIPFMMMVDLLTLVYGNRYGARGVDVVQQFHATGLSSLILNTTGSHACDVRTWNCMRG